MGKLLGPYEILESLATGGVGAVYRARDSRSGDLVALKLLREPTPQRVERFKREATALSRIRSPHVVGVHECGFLPSGEPYLAMELVRGVTVEERLATEGALSPAEALSVACAVARALATGHAQGLLHRDVKPANVLVRARDGVVVLTDYGLAKDLEAESSLTRTGQIVGTPGYLAPEQLGHAVTHVPATDVYGAGATLYAMLTGVAPFRGDTALECCQATLRDDPVPPSRLCRVSAELEAVCLRTLAKAPEARYETGGELLTALLCVDVAEQPPRSRAPALAAGGALAVLTGLAAWALSGATAEPQPQREPGVGTVTSEDATEAKGDTTQASADEAVEIEALLEQVQVLIRREDPQGPEAAAAALRRAPNHPQALALAGVVAYRQGRLDEALELFDRAILGDPRHADALNLRSQIHRAQGRVRQADRDLDRALEADPELSWSWGTLASVRSARGDTKGALEALNKAIELDPDARHLANRSMALALLGRVEEALGDADRAIEQEPSYARGWLVRGNLKRLSQDPTSLADYDEALRLEPGLLQARAARGNNRLTARDYAGAIRDTSLVLEASGPQSQFYRAAIVDLAIARMFSGELKAARAGFERALKLYPRDLDIQRWRCDALFRAGEYDAAIEGYRAILAAVGQAKADVGELITRFPKEYSLLMKIGLLQHQQGDRLETVKQLTRATRSEGASAYPALWLAALAGDRAPLAALQPGDDWPEPLVRYFRGAIDAAELLAEARADAASDVQARLCEAHGFLGAEAERRGDADAAAEHYAQALATERAEFLEFVWAAARLELAKTR